MTMTERPIASQIRPWVALILLGIAALTFSATAQDEPPAAEEPTPATPAGEIAAPAAKLLIKVEGAGMPGTWFDHVVHDTGECKSCHHLGRYDQKCTDCHKAKTEGEVAGAQLAFHENCYRCHIEGGASNGKAITCVECHKE